MPLAAELMDPRAESAMDYTAAKHGVHGLVRTAALELAPPGVRVNAVAPGITRTAMTAGVTDDLLADVPLGRIAEPEEIAHAVVWLASPKASYVTARYLPSTAVTWRADCAAHSGTPTRRHGWCSRSELRRPPPGG